MQANIQSILEELYTLEPSLREKEQQILHIIESMQKNRPNIIINEAFKKELRAKLLLELQQKPGLLPPKGTSDASQRGVYSQWRKEWNLGWIFAGLSTTAFAAFAGYTLLWGFAFQTLVPTWSDKSIMTVAHTTQRLSFAPNILKLANNAYGDTIPLSANTVSQLGRPEAMSSVSSQDRGAVGWVAQDAKMMTTDSMPYSEDYPYYQYTYTGSFPVYSGDLVVYKRNTLPFTSTETAWFLDGLALDGLNLASFENKSFSNLSFVEERDFWYSVNIDFQNGNVSFYQNWARWPQSKCDTNGCEQPAKLTKDDVPSDEDIIRIGDEFLLKYGIDRSLYGTPKIDSSWRIMYARALVNGAETTIPEQYTITYPILLEGKSLYEESGGYKWLTLSLDIRTKRVVSMYGLEKQNLSSSVYTTQTTEDTLRQILKYGGRYETKPYGEQKTVQISLGEPTFQYVHVYGEWKNGKSDEYYVPAYVFPVLNKPDGSYLQDSVIIPLVAEFAQFVPMTDTPVAEPMPALMEKAIQ